MRKALGFLVVLLAGCGPDPVVEATLPEKFLPTPISSLKPRHQTPPEVKPVLNEVEIGAFSAEAGDVIGLPSLDLEQLDNNARYARYRRSVREIYGADLCEMNRFSCKDASWPPKVSFLQNWLLRAGLYGSPTLDLRDLPSGHWNDNKGMKLVRDAFVAAQNQNIKVWVLLQPDAVVRFREMMPSNVKLVFAPDLETLDFASTLPLEGYDRAGARYFGNAPVGPIFHRYAAKVAAQKPAMELEVSELGVSLARSAEFTNFITNAAKGKWKRLRRINLVCGSVEGRNLPTIYKGSEVSFIKSNFFGVN